MPPGMGGNDLAQRLHGARKKPRKLQTLRNVQRGLQRGRKIGWGESVGHERMKTTSLKPLQEEKLAGENGWALFARRR
jgi:hypothetical protein